ncbi:glycoside hydrolase family 2 TIM barrel-domain containing protein [Mucilaginibacter glaciei]|uniref:Cellulase family glycosylhydrolase n=1 Tax=Mucilaginibacter glaciei TaxID=2772109 RepID=A0A926NJJ6_9SPHI|nr:glycoside hydrolase family 2 TIM barrel-domain containing protein [Mucilaginibacter glaciei]MBD1393254.1 cellulase family glycosylhydrolase [Mucilaginibacter glaciei]
MKSILFKTATLILLASSLFNEASAQKASAAKVWTPAKANAWYAQHKWMSGADFIPSTAINQLEMWQADTFDPTTIDRELGYAEGIGFNTMRVFLYSLAWQQDKAGFKKRVDQYLAIAAKHHIQTMFVFFDDCWNAGAKVGLQPAPKTGVHNSGWLQDPGNRERNAGENALLEAYVKDVLTTFKHDKRILLWDLYNEPGNSGKKDASMGLLANVFNWARAVNPDQPVSAGLWDWGFEKLNAYQASNSDIITYHDYTDEKSHLKTIQLLKTHGKPLICTEYMARTRGSHFSNIMPMLKQEHVGALNWGFVMGKTNTIYAWDNPMPDGTEPKEWFHDIFRKDGTPYKTDEVELIKKLNGK